MDDITGVLLDPDRGDTPRPKIEETRRDEPPVPDYSMFTSKVRV
jgi:hypothetical protein